MTTEYSFSVNWYDECREHPDRWTNRGRNSLLIVLEDKEHERFKEIAEAVGMLKDDGELEDYYEEAGDYCEPMMNYAYPLHHEPKENEILDIVTKTSCTVMENEDNGEFFLVLTGGGMDLSQSIAHAYTICGDIPDAFAFNVSEQYGLNISGDTYFKVMKKVRESLSDAIEAYKNKIARIDEAIKDAKARNKKNGKSN